MTKTLTQTQIKAQIVSDTGLTKAQVDGVLDSLLNIVTHEFKKHGEFKLLGLVKFVAEKKPAVKGGKTAINPFTKAEYVTKDKPACIKVKARPLAALKAMV